MNQPFRQRRRQQFLTESYFQNTSTYLKGERDHWATELQATGDSEEQRRMLSLMTHADFSYMLFALKYTAGEPPEQLRSELTGVIEAYERYQMALGVYEGRPQIAPFTFAELAHYERCMQLIGLCYLLHRHDLLPRIAALQDPAYIAEDTLYEDLLAYELEGRYDVDEWHHDVPYRRLINCLYGETEASQVADLQAYVQSWYPAFKQTPWHDGHLRIDGDEGDYFGYWAFEAGAVAYLLELDDASINHMVYPKDLVAFARAYRDNAAPDTRPPRTPAGEPCPKEGYWFTPAHSDSRRHFKQGEVMPDFKNPLWATLWQWDENQKDPSQIDPHAST